MCQGSKSRIGKWSALSIFVIVINFSEVAITTGHLRVPAVLDIPCKAVQVGVPVEKYTKYLRPAGRSVHFLRVENFQKVEGEALPFVMFAEVDVDESDVLAECVDGVEGHHFNAADKFALHQVLHPCEDGLVLRRATDSILVVSNQRVVAILMSINRGLHLAVLADVVSDHGG